MNNNINIDNNLVNLKDILYNKKVIVPIIQRGYAQGRTDVEATDIRDKFLDSIITYLFNENYNNDFILDIIYGVNDDNIFYPIDGQQRLTTLFLFHWYIYNHLKADRTFLSNFSYETRITSTDFLSLLNSDKINIDFDKDIISNQIISNISFLNYYRKDPTVKGILLVLDEIHKKIKSYIKADNNKEDILKRLDNIKFFKLDIKGDYDDLYIKMNSRGKQLTDFEIFKSKFEKFLDENNIIIKDKNGQGFDKKIDIDWTNFIWDFIKESNNNKDEGNELDGLFMKLFSFIFEMLYYSQIEIVEDTRKLQIEKSNLDFFELFFSHKGDKEKKEYINKLKANPIENELNKKIALKNNIEFIINIFDILSSLGKNNLNVLFNRIFYYNNESKNDEDKYNKICTFNNNLNVFNNNNNDNLFDFLRNIEKRILIFSVFKILNYEYLKNKENIKDIDNIKNKYFNKLRLIRNLLYNTDNLYGNIYYQIKLIDKIITEDEFEVINTQLSKESIKNTLFTKELIKSEKKKLEKLNKNNENINNNIYACENNVFLQGNIDFLLDNIGNEYIVDVVNYIFTTDGFNKENNYLVHRAISIYIKDNFILFKDIDNQRTLINDNEYKKNKCLSNFINDLLPNIKNNKVEDYTRSLTNMINEFSDENDFRFYIIKELQYEERNKNIVNISLYHDNYIKNNSSIDSQYIYYYNNRVSCWDIALSDKIYTIFDLFKDKIDKEFELYYLYYPYKKGEYYDEKLDCNRILRYGDKKLLYCYQWVTLAKEIEIAGETVLVGFTTDGYCLECGLRKKIPYEDKKKTSKVLTKIEQKVDIKKYDKCDNDFHWYYYKYFDTCGNISLLKKEYKILKPVIDAFSTK